MTELRGGAVNLPNDNFDVGEATARGKYRMSDDVCAQLLDKLAEQQFAGTSPELRAELSRFFSGPEPPASARLTKKSRSRLKEEIQRLETTELTPTLNKTEEVQTNPQ